MPLWTCPTRAQTGQHAWPSPVAQPSVYHRGPLQLNTARALDRHSNRHSDSCMTAEDSNNRPGEALSMAVPRQQLPCLIGQLGGLPIAGCNVVLALPRRTRQRLGQGSGHERRHGAPWGTHACAHTQGAEGNRVSTTPAELAQRWGTPSKKLRKWWQRWTAVDLGALGERPWRAQDAGASL